MLFVLSSFAAVFAALIGWFAPACAASTATLMGEFSMVGAAYIAVRPGHTAKIKAQITWHGAGMVPFALMDGDIHADCADWDMVIQFASPEAHIAAFAVFGSDNFNPKKNLYADLLRTKNYDFRPIMVPVVHTALKILDETGAPIADKNLAAYIRAQAEEVDDLPGAEDAGVLFHAIADGGANNKLRADDFGFGAIRFGASALNAADGVHYVRASFGCEYSAGEAPRVIPIKVGAAQKVCFLGNNRHYNNAGKLSAGVGAEVVFAHADAVPSASIDLGTKSRLTLPDGAAVIAGQTITCGSDTTLAVSADAAGAAGCVRFQSGSLLIL